MTKKDYELIEKQISLAVNLMKRDKAFIQKVDALELTRGIVGQIAIGLKEENSKFNEKKFYEACGFW